MLDIKRCLPTYPASPTNVTHETYCLLFTSWGKLQEKSDDIHNSKET